MIDPIVRARARDQRLIAERAGRIIHDRHAAAPTYLYDIVHGAPVGNYSTEGVAGLDTEPTACAANFATWTIVDVINGDIELPEGFGIVQHLDGGLHWFCNYIDVTSRDLFAGDMVLCHATLSLQISGSSPAAYVSFLVPRGSTVS